MMQRRAFLAGTSAAVIGQPLSAWPQERPKKYRFGLLASRPAPPVLDNFHAEMRRYGWIEGRHYDVDARFTKGEQQRASALASDLVAQAPDIILTFNTANALVARQAAPRTPIVMVTSGYPVETGLVESLSKPRGNVTGNTIYAGAEVFGKYVSLLYEVVPTIRRIGAVWDYSPPAFPPIDIQAALDELRRAVSAVSATLILKMIRSAVDVPAAVDALDRDNVQGMLVTNGPVNSGVPSELAGLVRKRRIPVVTDFALNLLTSGTALLAYSANLAALGTRAAYFVDRILRGTKPGDLPIELPSKFDLIVNLRTARALGLTIPPSLLLRADQVIE